MSSINIICYTIPVEVKSVWINIRRTLIKKRTISQFLILISFLTTFLIVRIVTHLQKAHILGNQNGTLHIHHMVPGIILLLITGFIGISFSSKEMVRHMNAVFFGIGAALTLDEFSLWLFLQNVYWAKQGRDSIDAIIVVIVLIMLSLLVTEISIFKRKQKKV